jgi:hypothetical protein
MRSQNSYRTGWLGSKDWRKEKVKTRGWYDSRSKSVVLGYEGSEKIVVYKGVRTKAWLLLRKGKTTLWLTSNSCFVEVAWRIDYRAFPTLVPRN